MRLKGWILLLTISSFIATLLIYPLLPPIIATHWGINGQVDGTSGKWTQLFLGALPLAMYVFMVLLPRIDPRSDNYKLHDKAYTAMEVSLAIFLIGLNWTTIAFNLGYPVDIQKIVVLSLGVLIMVMGNYMVQFRYNYFCGLRTPWTLASEEVWRKSHRFAGRLHVAAGMIVVVSAFFTGTLAFIATIGSVLLAALISTIYSYIVFRSIQKRDSLSK